MAAQKIVVDPNVPLPPGLPPNAIRSAVSYIEKNTGRTHTFGVKNPATKLAGCAVYRRADIVIRDGKPVHRSEYEPGERVHPR